MSASAYLSVEMTDVEVVQRMCQRNGWEVRVNGNIARIIVPGIYHSLNFDLSGQRQPWYDSDVRHSLHKEVVQNDVRCRDGSQDRQLADRLQIEYDTAAAIVGAERKGYRVTEGRYDNGQTWVDIFTPEREQGALETLVH